MIKAAGLRNVAVEDLASQILGEAIREKLSGVMIGEVPNQRVKTNPLTGLEPYTYDATPEQSAFPEEEWNMEHQAE